MGLFSIKAGHLPQRITAGAFILNSGIGKLSADEATAAQLHGFAVGLKPRSRFRRSAARRRRKSGQ